MYVSIFDHWKNGKNKTPSLLNLYPFTVHFHICSKVHSFIKHCFPRSSIGTIWQYLLTQPDGTLFFLIFTYLRGRSHSISRDYASNVEICHFLKPETNKGDFRLYFELVEKSCRGRHHSEISKTNTKTLIYSIWIRPQGSLGCQKMRQGPLNTPFEVWRANIASKLKNIQNTLRKQGFFDIFFQF